ncbi:MAG: 2-hydroxyacyl-CoA dehydratase [Candidatus Thorarchaeota archaeon]|nr:2-hydroxyacyl-CoA dehydratase [Candidatus Thorarchaeota archaeon]
MKGDQVLLEAKEILPTSDDSQIPKIGYFDHRAPLEMIVAHTALPSLVRASRKPATGFESSLQTFACSFSRNLLSQRVQGNLSHLEGLLFPSNMCDSMQNLHDIWEVEFPRDNILQVGYPVVEDKERSVEYLAGELGKLSASIQGVVYRSLDMMRLRKALNVFKWFRNMCQEIYAARVLQPDILRYTEFVQLLCSFLESPSVVALEELETIYRRVKNSVKRPSTASKIRQSLLQGHMDEMAFPVKSPPLRIVVAGGMTDPIRMGELFDAVASPTEAAIVLDLLSFGYRMIFKPTAKLERHLFKGLAEMTVKAPTAPTQKGLKTRVAFLKKLLRNFSIDGLIVTEMSFCDPDEFETPSLVKAAQDVGVTTLRLPVDAEFSDKARLEGRIQSFLETLSAQMEV